MDKIIAELNKLKKSIDEAKTQVSVLQDRKDQALKRLKEDYGLATIELAEKWVLKTEKELQKAEAEINKLFKGLKENYEW